VPTRAKTKDPLELATRLGLEEAVRRVLVGEPLRGIRRVVSMVCLGFGRRRWRTNRRGKRVLVAEYALHTESSWRLLGPDGLITGKADMLYTRDEPPGYPDDDDETWGSVGNTRCDKRLEALGPLLGARRLVVRDAAVDAGFMLDLDFGDGYSLRILPTATAGEHWRLFSSLAHLVVGPGTG
jgi:hypothetical protein